MTRWQEERGVYWGRMKRKWYIKYYKSDRRTEKKEGWAAERGTEEEEEEEGWWTNSEPPVQSAAEVGKVFCGRCNYSENVKDGGRGSESGERERELHVCTLLFKYSLDSLCEDTMSMCVWVINSLLYVPAVVWLSGFLWSCVNHSRNTDGADMNCCVCVCVCRLLTSDNFSSSQHHFIRVLIDTFMQYPVKKMLHPLISWRRPASGSRTCPASLQTEPPVASLWSCSSWWSLLRINSFLFKFYIDGFRRSGSDSEVTEICLCDFFGGQMKKSTTTRVSGS